MRMLATPEHVLALSLLVVIVLCGAWDVWASASQQPLATVSNIIGEWSKGFPVLPLAVGIILGHIFWPRGGGPGPGTGPK